MLYRFSRTTQVCDLFRDTTFSESKLGLIADAMNNVLAAPQDGTSMHGNLKGLYKHDFWVEGDRWRILYTVENCCGKIENCTNDDCSTHPNPESGCIGLVLFVRIKDRGEMDREYERRKKYWKSFIENPKSF